MFIPTTYWSTQGTTLITEQSVVSGNGLITTGTFKSGSTTWDYWKFEMSDKTNPNLTSSVFNFTILSGSTQRANILVVGGGAGGSTTGSLFDETYTYAVDVAAGGGGGGVVYYSNFTLSPGTYEIGVGKAANHGTNPSYPGTNNSNILGRTGSISYFNNKGVPYTPFTGSITAYGGGNQNVRGQFYSFNAGNRNKLQYGVDGASGGGAASAEDLGPFPNYVGPLDGTQAVSTWYNGLSLGLQGNKGGWFSGGDNTQGINYAYGTGGGGYLTSGSNTGTGSISVYGTDGGLGVTYSTNGTASLYSGGGAGVGGPNPTSVGTRGGNSYGVGGNGWGAGQSETLSFGYAGVVIIAAPRVETYYPNTLITNGLVIFNPSNGLSGSMWYDASGNCNNAIVSGSTLSLSGSLGYEFNGTNNFLEYPLNLGATPSSSWTMQWYGSGYITGSGLISDTTNYFLFGKYSYTNGWDSVYRGYDQAMVLRDVLGADDTGSTGYTGGELGLFTFVIENSGSTKLYFNKELINTGNGPMSDFNSASLSPLRFGYDTGADANWFKGTVKALTLYNRALSLSEIKSNYNYLFLNNGEYTFTPCSTTTTTTTTSTTTTSTTTTTTTLAPQGCMSSSYSGLEGDIYYTTAQTASYTSASTAVNNLYSGVSYSQLDGTFAGTYYSTDNAWEGQINLTDATLDYGTWFFLAKIPTGSIQREFLGSAANLRHVGINNVGKFKIQGGIYEATSSLNLSSVANYSTQYKVYVWERTSASSSQFRIEDDNFTTPYPTQVGGLPYTFLTGMDEICKNTGYIKAVAAYNVDSSVANPLQRMSVTNIRQVAANMKGGINVC